MALALANRYAQALADVVSKPGAAVEPQAAIGQLAQFQELLDLSKPLRGVLVSPAVTPADKRALAATLCQRLEVAAVVRNFLFVVIDHRRMSFLGEMVKAFQEWLDDRAGVARLLVTTATPIGGQQQSALIEKFSRVTGSTVVAEFDVSSDLVGGATVRHASTLFDGSLRAQLKALDRAVAGES